MRGRLRRRCPIGSPGPRKPSGPVSADAEQHWRRRSPAFALGKRFGTVTSVSGRPDIKFNFDLAADLKPEEVPMLPVARARYAERQDNLGKDDPEGYCLAPGFPRVNGVPFPQKIIQTPAFIVVRIRDADHLPANLP